MIPLPTIIDSLPPLAVKVEVAAAAMGISRWTLKRKYIDSGRIAKNDDGRVWVSDLQRIHDEELAKRHKAVLKLRRVA